MSQWEEREKACLYLPPWSCEWSPVDVEFWISQTSSTDGTRRIGDLLQSLLGTDIVVDVGPQARVKTKRVSITRRRVDNIYGICLGNLLVDDDLESQCRISGPGVQVVGIRR